MSKSNRWVKLADHLPWDRIEKEYNKRLRNSHYSAGIACGYTYVDHLSWDAYNESSDLGMQLELYKKRFGMLPREIQADKLYLGKENRKHIKSCHVNCYNRPLDRPPKEENDTYAEDKKRAIGERNEIEGMQALKAGRLSLGWADYMFGPSLIIPGIIDIFELKQ